MTDNPKVIGAAQNMVKRYINGVENAINPNVESSVFPIVLRNGGSTRGLRYPPLLAPSTVTNIHRSEKTSPYYAQIKQLSTFLH